MASRKQKTVSRPVSGSRRSVSGAENQGTGFIPKPKRAPRTIGLSVSKPLCILLFALFFLFLGWYWGWQYQDLLYLFHYYKVPQREDLFFPGGAVSFLGAVPSLAGARYTMAAGVLLMLGYFGFFTWSLWSVLNPVREDGRISPKWLLTLAVPSILTILLALQGYYHFSQVKSEIFIGAFFGIGTALIFPYYLGRIRRTFWRVTLEILFLILFYPLFGGYEMIGALYLIQEEWRRKSEPCFWGRIILPLLGGLLIPLFEYSFYSARFPVNQIWTAGFILLDKGYTEELHYQFTQRLNELLLACSLLPLIFGIFSKKRDSRTAAPEAASVTEAVPITETVPVAEVNRKPAWNGLFFSAAITLLIGAAIEMFSMTDQNYLALLAVVRPLENDQWDGILEIEAECPNPSVPLIAVRRLALAMTGQTAERLFERTNDPATSKDLRIAKTTNLLGTEVEFRFGLVNLAIRNINEALRLRPDSPFYRWSIFLSSVANEEYSLAEKHLALLKPLGRSDWYRTGREILDAFRQGTMPQTPEGILVYNRVKTARGWRPPEYILNDDTVNRNIMENATHYHFAEAPRILQELLLGEMLLYGQVEKYREWFDLYDKARRAEEPNYRIPAALQEGMIFCEYLETKKTPSKYPYDPELLKRFADYLSVTRRLEGSSGMDREARERLETEFFNSFWYYQMFIFQFADY